MTGIFARRGRQYTYFLWASNTEYADIANNIGWKGVWVCECYLLNEQSPMPVKPWVSACLPAPHQPCSATAASSLNVILALLWHGVTQKCCAFNQPLKHGCTSHTMLFTSGVFTSIPRAKPSPSCSLSCMPFGLCPIIWHRYWCSSQNADDMMLKLYSHVWLSRDTGCLHFLVMRAMFPSQCSVHLNERIVRLQTSQLWPQGSVLGSVTACFLQTYN